MDRPASVRIDDDCLRRWPLPQPSPAGDKEERGRVAIIAGGREMPGAALLAATAALHAGAGKLVVGTGASVAVAVAVALPEARVIALPESADGALLGEGAALVRTAVVSADALLLGPGWLDGSTALASAVVAAASPHTRIILDAGAMQVIHEPGPRPIFLLTPHAGEMAHLCETPVEDIERDPEARASAAAEEWNCVVALKGACTFIASPTGSRWRHDGGSPGLGTSGSGDVLAGLIAGLVARGCTLEQAAAWGVFLHARAGAALSKKFGPIGFLARHLSAEVPGLMNDVGSGTPA